MDLRENGRAILAMMVAMAAFIVNDTLIKLASERLPLGEIIFVRSAIAGTAYEMIVHRSMTDRSLDRQQML